MADGQLTVVLRHIRQLAGVRPAEELTDGQLLEGFVSRQDEAAFEALVRRHSPLVLGVCRRVLQHAQDAEDAFQATFLVLARKAASIRRKESLGSWLYGVAYHIAAAARLRAARRRSHERQAHDMAQSDAKAEALWAELQPILDEELQQLPDKYRQALLLCYLEGKSNRQAARELGWPPGSMSRRLTRARELLRLNLKRRGVSLGSAALTALLTYQAAPAAVPLLLVDTTVRAALRFAAGKTVGTIVSRQAVSLAREILKGMTPTASKIATVILLAIGILALGTRGHEASAQKPGPGSAGRPEAPKQSAAAKAAREAAEAQPTGETPETMTIRGRVLDPSGKPVAGARVGVLARHGVRLSLWENYLTLPQELLGQGRTDDAGRFRLSVPRMGPATYRQAWLVAACPGYGLNWHEIAPNLPRAEADLRLFPEQIVRGRFLDLQGQPAAGVKVQVRILQRPGKNGRTDILPLPEGGCPLGPPAATTDAHGRFALRGLGGNMTATLRMQDGRTVLHELGVATAGRKGQDQIKTVLPPCQVLQGRVIGSKDGPPLAGARVRVWAWTVNEVGSIRNARPAVEGRTDAQGRFHIPFFPGNRVQVRVLAPEGSPYLSMARLLIWPRGTVRQEIVVALPQGRLVRGQITEAASGLPVAGAFVEVHYPRPERSKLHDALTGWEVHARSGADGRYRIAVPLGLSRLVVTGPSSDYIPTAVGSAELRLGKPGGDPTYFHATAALDLKPADPAKEVPLRLRRGVTIRGRLLGPDGKRVPRAVMFCGSHPVPSAPGALEKNLGVQNLRDGRFELRGCDPGRNYRLLFLDRDRDLPDVVTLPAAPGSRGYLWLPRLLDPPSKLAAAVEVSARKAAARPVDVCLEPCGSARIHFVDAAIKPIPKQVLWLDLLVSPGPSVSTALDRGVLAGEKVTLAGSYYVGDIRPFLADAQGEITVNGLIPGATYRLKKTYQAPLKDFTVKAGKTTDLWVVVN
jgi:RNA polymerase sigma factor (sigma-70 family)